MTVQRLSTDVTDANLNSITKMKNYDSFSLFINYKTRNDKIYIKENKDKVKLTIFDCTLISNPLEGNRHSNSFGIAPITSTRTFSFLPKNEVGNSSHSVLLENVAFFEYDALPKSSTTCHTFKFCFETLHTYSSSLITDRLRIDSLFNDATTSDIKLKCKRAAEDEIDGEAMHVEDFIKAHKSILKAVSTYFGAMFSANLPELEFGVLEITDIKFENLKFILKHIYTNELDIDRIKLMSLEDFIEIFEKAKIWELTSFCNNLEVLGYHLLQIPKPFMLLKACHQNSISGPLYKRAVEDIKLTQQGLGGDLKIKDYLEETSTEFLVFVIESLLK